MNGALVSGVFRPRAGIAWSKDADRVVIAGTDRSCATVLEGVDAVVWSSLATSPSWRRLTELVAALLQVDLAAADERVRALLADWLSSGLLEPAGSSVAVNDG